MMTTLLYQPDSHWTRGFRRSMGLSSSKGHTWEITVKRDSMTT